MKYLILSKKIWSQNIKKSINKNYGFENRLNVKRIHKQKPKIIFLFSGQNIYQKNI